MFTNLTPDDAKRFKALKESHAALVAALRLCITNAEEAAKMDQHSALSTLKNAPNWPGIVAGRAAVDQAENLGQPVITETDPRQAKALPPYGGNAGSDRPSGEPSILNYYECSRCQAKWQDIWSCACNDQCPSCGLKGIEPYKSEETSP